MLDAAALIADPGPGAAETAPASAMPEWVVRVGEFIVTYGSLLGLAGAALLLVLFVLSRVNKRRPIKPILIFVGSNLALLLNAEGMWEVVTEQLGVPPHFAILAFAVFEVALMVTMDLAKARYVASTVRDDHGKIIQAGRAGGALVMVWLIALSSGVIVATHGGSLTEVLLRLALPAMVVGIWWVTLTGEAAGAKRSRGRFAYDPRRLAERWGLVIPEKDDDLELARRDRHVRKLVVYGDRVRTRIAPVWFWTWRMTRLARVAEAAAVTDAVAQLDAVQGSVKLLVGERGDVTGKWSARAVLRPRAYLAEIDAANRSRVAAAAAAVRAELETELAARDQADQDHRRQLEQMQARLGEEIEAARRAATETGEDTAARYERQIETMTAQTRDFAQQIQSQLAQARAERDEALAQARTERDKALAVARASAEAEAARDRAVEDARLAADLAADAERRLVAAEDRAAQALRTPNPPAPANAPVSGGGSRRPRPPADAQPIDLDVRPGLPKITDPDLKEDVRRRLDYIIDFVNHPTWADGRWLTVAKDPTVDEVTVGTGKTGRGLNVEVAAVIRRLRAHARDTDQVPTGASS